MHLKSVLNLFIEIDLILVLLLLIGAKFRNSKRSDTKSIMEASYYA